jgi:proteasome lid subunit RPN8/RPN11
VVIPAELYKRMIRQATDAFPEETCGILASDNGTARQVYPIANVSQSPVIFQMDSQEQLAAVLEIEDRGWDLGAVYHSHPRTPAVPSETDVKFAFYPEALTIIISLANRARPEMRAYRIVDGQVSEETIDVPGGG